MRIFMRVLLTLYILFFMLIAGVVLACAWGIIANIHPVYWLDMLYTNTLVRVIVSVVGIVVVVLSVMLMFSGIRKRRPKAALITDTGSGVISISVSALEEMAVRHIIADSAIRNVKAAIAIRDGKIHISARLAVAEGANIPEVLKSLQTSLKEQIQLLSGIEVGKISLLVEKTSQVAKARVD